MLKKVLSEKFGSGLWLNSLSLCERWTKVSIEGRSAKILTQPVGYDQ
jgi:hypothetical protein